MHTFLSGAMLNLHIIWLQNYMRDKRVWHLKALAK